MSHARERGTRRGCAARIFNGASACVRLSSPRDLSGGEKKTEEAKRRGERANERKNGLFNRELDSMTQVRAILVPFIAMVFVFFLSFLFPFLFFFINLLNALNYENVFRLKLRESQSVFLFLFICTRNASKFFLRVTLSNLLKIHRINIVIYNI